MKRISNIPLFLAGAALCVMPGLLRSQQEPRSQDPARQSGPDTNRNSRSGSSSSSQTHGTSARIDAGGASQRDRQFVEKALMGGEAEVKLGRMAVQQASSAEVKRFGQRMVDDHSRANDKLKLIASDKAITSGASLDKKHEAVIQRLAKLSGAQFDKAYMEEMLRDHREDVAEFEEAASLSTDPDVKAFASETLPTLKEHLKMAENARSSSKH